MNKNTARMRKLHNGPCAFLIGIATMFLPVYCLAQSSAPVGPVLIGGQPQNQMVVAPGSATFSVTALGTAPITYHWNKNGSPISGATSPTYTTPPTTSADSDVNFTVTVSNSVGGFTSAPGTLAASRHGRNLAGLARQGGKKPVRD
jgi:hypothetical protein